MDSGEPESARPSWMPADGVLAAIVPVSRFLIRAQHLVVALSHVAAYPNGCMLEMQAGVRAGVRGLDIHARDAFDSLVFALRFGDDITAVMDDDAPWRALGQGPLMLMRYGLQSTAGPDGGTGWRSDGALRLWLHPLPPAVTGTLSIIAPDPGPELAACPVDGRAIVAAARHAQPYWP